jgi:hypothetical protein
MPAMFEPYLAPGGADRMRDQIAASLDMDLVWNGVDTLVRMGDARESVDAIQEELGVDAQVMAGSSKRDQGVILEDTTQKCLLDWLMPFMPIQVIDYIERGRTRTPVKPLDGYGSSEDDDSEEDEDDWRAQMLGVVKHNELKVIGSSRQDVILYSATSGNPSRTSPALVLKTGKRKRDDEESFPNKTARLDSSNETPLPSSSSPLRKVDSNGKSVPVIYNNKKPRHLDEEIQARARALHAKIVLARLQSTKEKAGRVETGDSTLTESVRGGGASMSDITLQTMDEITLIRTESSLDVTEDITLVQHHEAMSTPRLVQKESIADSIVIAGHMPLLDGLIESSDWTGLTCVGSQSPS